MLSALALLMLLGCSCSRQEAQKALASRLSDADRVIVLNPDDAFARGLAEGAMAKVSDGTGTAALPVVISPRVAAGAAWIESGYGATAPLSVTAALVVTGA